MLPHAANEVWCLCVLREARVLGTATHVQHFIFAEYRSVVVGSRSDVVVVPVRQPRRAPAPGAFREHQKIPAKFPVVTYVQPRCRRGAPCGLLWQGPSQ